ncbi:hypothetical protein JB92DRAFT_3134826 [Gautieria morchelliformis]|nr:hypothetical protein JB92DRAFT_3134826 [Gautieria morchelliformis]
MTARAFDIFQRPDKPGFLAGANTLDISSIGIALGLLSDNASIVADAHDCVHNEVQAQSGFQLDGIQQDGSFSQHQGLLYNAATKRKALQEINLTQLPTRSTLEDPSSVGPGTNRNPHYQPQFTQSPDRKRTRVEADKQRLAHQRERRLAPEEEARALDAEVAALRDEGLGVEEIAEFLSDPNANVSEDEPGPQTRPGRIQANKFAFKATMAVVTAASKPSVSNAVRRQTASSPVPLRSVTRDVAQPHRPSACSPGPRPDNGHMDRTHGEQGLGPGVSPAAPA